MNYKLQAIRAVSTLALRKMAAEVLDPAQLTPKPVVPTPVPLPDGALDPSTQAPAVATPPIANAPQEDLLNKFVPPPKPPLPAAPTITAPPTPPVAPGLAAQLPAGHTVDQPLPAGTTPPPKTAPAAPAADAPAAAPTAKNMFQTFADKAKALAQGATDKMNATIDERIGANIDGLNAVDKQPDTGWMTTAGDFFSDWRNWLVPVGALATLFGGSTLKLLGGLAMGAGGVDLYNRYKGVEGLGHTPQGQQLIQSALTFKDAQGKPKPFGNIQDLAKAAPDQAQALNDLSLLARLGAKNQLINRVVEAGVTEGEKQGVPANVIINRLVETKRLDAKQGQEMLKNLEASKQRLAQQTPAKPVVTGG